MLGIASLSAGQRCCSTTKQACARLCDDERLSAEKLVDGRIVGVQNLDEVVCEIEGTLAISRASVYIGSF